MPYNLVLSLLCCQNSSALSMVTPGQIVSGDEEQRKKLLLHPAFSVLLKFEQHLAETVVDQPSPPFIKWWWNSYRE